jgi:hypothetical protein
VAAATNAGMPASNLGETLRRFEANRVERLRGRMNGAWISDSGFPDYDLRTKPGLPGVFVSRLLTTMGP